MTTEDALTINIPIEWDNVRPPEDIIATLDFFDKNDDEMLCVLDLPAGPNLIDNNASIP